MHRWGYPLNELIRTNYSQVVRLNIFSQNTVCFQFSSDASLSLSVLFFIAFQTTWLISSFFTCVRTVKFFHFSNFSFRYFLNERGATDWIVYFASSVKCETNTFWNIRDEKLQLNGKSTRKIPSNSSWSYDWISSDSNIFMSLLIRF